MVTPVQDVAYVLGSFAEAAAEAAVVADGPAGAVGTASGVYEGLAIRLAKRGASAMSAPIRTLSRCWWTGAPR